MTDGKSPTAGRGKSPLVVLFLIVVIDLIGFGIVLPLLPRYATEYHATPVMTGVLMASFSAMQFFFAPFWGRLSDRRGRRPILMVGLFGSIVSYTIFGLAHPLSQWLHANVLAGKWVLAVAGTHGKTTTTSMLAWILDHAGLNPGFLIGGVPENFNISARLPGPPPIPAFHHQGGRRNGGAGIDSASFSFFVIEADEYDTAFFDKRSKFVHYAPRTVILNNLEFDHADIFPDLAAIETQFHHLVRTVPAAGLIVSNGADANLERVLERGAWTPVERFGIDSG